MPDDVIKDASYYESAIIYNETLQKAAEGVLSKIEHPRIQQWCRGVAKQHKFHAGRMQRALKRFHEESEVTENNESQEIGTNELTQDEIDRLEAQTQAAQPVESAPDPELAAAPVDAGVETEIQNDAKPAIEMVVLGEGPVSSEQVSQVQEDMSAEVSE